MKFKRPLALLVASGIAGQAQATLVTFTGGTVHYAGGGTATTVPGIDLHAGVDYYEESGIVFDFVGADEFIGDYYNDVTGGLEPVEDVIHGHWAPNLFGAPDPPVQFGTMTSIVVTQPTGGVLGGALIPFDLNYFRITTNTGPGAGPGSSASGGEMVYVNALAADLVTVLDSVLLPSSAWGIADGTPEVYLPATFDGIFGFSITNDPLSPAVGFGMDEFFIDEPPPPPGQGVPEPAEVFLGLLAAAGLIAARRRQQRST